MVGMAPLIHDITIPDTGISYCIYCLFLLKSGVSIPSTFNRKRPTKHLHPFDYDELFINKDDFFPAS